MPSSFDATARWLSTLFVVVLSACSTGVVATSAPPPSPTVCPNETKTCLDGTTVTRSGPQCEFDPCPDPVQQGAEFSADPAPQVPDGGTHPKPIGAENPPLPPG